MKLNVASGDHANLAAGWVSIDQHNLPHWPRPPDVRGSILAMPFADHIFDTAYCGHVLEHLEWPDQLHTFGEELRRVLAPGAEVMIVGPALDLAEQTGQPDWLLDDIRENPDRDSSGMTHAWTATVNSTLEAARLLGLHDITQVDITEVTYPDWPNPTTAPWQVAVSAHT